MMTALGALATAGQVGRPPTLRERFRRAPTWQKVVGGLALAGVVTAAFLGNVGGFRGGNGGGSKSSSASGGPRIAAVASKKKAAQSGGSTQPNAVTQASQIDVHLTPFPTVEGSESHLAHAIDAPTVAKTVKALQPEITSTAATKELMKNSAKYGPKIVEHPGNAVDSLASEFGPDIGPNAAALGAYLGIENSVGNAQDSYAALRQVMPNLPANPSVEQMRATLQQFYTGEGTTFIVGHPTGTFENHFQHGETTGDAGPVHLNGTEAVLQVTNADGVTIYYKIFDNVCENPLTLNEAQAPAPVFAPTPGHVVTVIHHKGHKVHIRHPKPGGGLVINQPPTNLPKPKKPAPPPPATTTPPPPAQQLPQKVAQPTPGPDHASQSPGTPSAQEPAIPAAGVGPNATSTGSIPATITQPPAPTIPENTAPTATEPTAPVVLGSSNGEAAQPTPGASQSTQSNGSGGVQGQGGNFDPNTAAVGVGNASGTAR